MARFQFNVNDAPQMSDMVRRPLPPGQYEAMITKSELRDTRAGTGQYISLEMQVISGDHSGRRLWDNLNVSNPSKDAEDRGKAALRAICTATGKFDMEDTEELHDIPLMIVVDIDQTDKERNKIKRYLPMQAAPESSAPAAKPAAPSAARPWR